MPAGCDFICKNENCDNYNTGFVITGPWPMGSINDVIASRRVQELPELQKQLQELKESGREYAAITFPNVDDVETKCYRINLWSVEGKCLWQYEVVVEQNETLAQAIERENLPEKCPKTNSEMLDYKSVVKEGINCPSCNQELNQNRWFTKEN